MQDSRSSSSSPVPLRLHFFFLFRPRLPVRLFFSSRFTAKLHRFNARRSVESRLLKKIIPILGSLILRKNTISSHFVIAFPGDFAFVHFPLFLRLLSLSLVRRFPFAGALAVSDYVSLVFPVRSLFSFPELLVSNVARQPRRPSSQRIPYPNVESSSKDRASNISKDL